MGEMVLVSDLAPGRKVLQPQASGGDDDWSEFYTPELIKSLGLVRLPELLTMQESRQ